MDDLPALRTLMAQSIGTLQKGFLTGAQIETSRGVMGLDTQLVADGTYFVVLFGDTPAGCGGWSRRATLFGGDHTPGRDAALLDPGQDAARVRAMYTAPAFARRGVGRLILRLCEDAALAEGFARVELAATLAGQPLYAASGYTVLAPIDAPVPLLRMGKPLAG
jgi:GNAT superfamily N-acetyltransferase